MIGGGGAQAAVAGLAHQVAQVTQLLQVVGGGLAGRDLFHQGLQQAAADPAGGAEAATLMGEEAGEVASHVHEVTLPTQDHEGTGGGQVLEGQGAVELGRRQGHPRRAGDLDGLGATAAAVRKDLAYRGAEGVFVDPRPGHVAANAQQLAAGGLLGAGAPEPVATPLDDTGGGQEGLDIVDHRGPPQKAADDGIGRPLAHHAAPALQGFDEGRFLAANIGPGAEVNVDVEVKTLLTGDIPPQQALLPPPLQHPLEARHHVAVFAPQIEVALARADDAGAQGHAFENQVGVAVE